MRIMIIGGTRFIGPFVLRELVDMGHELYLFHRGISTTDFCDKGNCIHADRSDLLDYVDQFKDFDPEVVLDMVALGEHDALDVISAFRGLTGRLVGISSQDVYRAYGIMIGLETGTTDQAVLSEEAPLRDKYYPYRSQVKPEHRLYHYDKILVETAYMRDPDLSGTILRLPMVYGPGDYQHRIFPYLKRMDDGRPAIILEEGIAKWRWTKGYVEDVARAIVLTVTDERSAGRIYNVGEMEPLCEADWVKAIAASAGWHGEILTFSNDELPEHLKTKFNTDQNLVSNSNLIREELGYSETISRTEALLRTVEWERSNPPGDIDPKQFDYLAENALLGIAPTS